jgi:hypothetical protein
MQSEQVGDIKVQKRVNECEIYDMLFLCVLMMMIKQKKMLVIKLGDDTLANKKKMGRVCLKT